MKIIHEITLDVSRQGIQCSVPVTQHDAGVHRLIIHLRNGSAPLSLSENDSAVIHFDTDVIDAAAVYTSESAYPSCIVYDLTLRATAEYGEHKAVLQIYKGEERIMFTPVILLSIRKDTTSSSGVLTSSQYSAVVKAAQLAEEYARQTEEALGEHYEDIMKIGKLEERVGLDDNIPDEDANITAGIVRLSAFKADLVDGKVPASQLPSYVDDVVEYARLAKFPKTGELSKIYIDTSTNDSYRWSGTGYVKTTVGDIPITSGRGKGSVIVNDLENNKAENEMSAALGLGTETYAATHLAVGRYNYNTLQDEGSEYYKPLFSVGDGVSAEERSNAFSITYDEAIPSGTEGRVRVHVGGACLSDGDVAYLKKSKPYFLTTNLVYPDCYEVMTSSEIEGIQQGIETLIVREGVTSLGIGTFISATFKTVIFPSTLTYLEEDALYYGGAETMIFNSKTPPTLSGSMVMSVNKIIVPYNSLEAYKSATCWCEKADIIDGVLMDSAIDESELDTMLEEVLIS
ncbi:MAG: hypothetical protein IJ038_02895 [Clostridia bacterium]|nr:hypothetical protein [Clostridia bacterium]